MYKPFPNSGEFVSKLAEGTVKKCFWEIHILEFLGSNVKLNNESEEPANRS
jgi:hypothetical protein